MRVGQRVSWTYGGKTTSGKIVSLKGEGLHTVKGPSGGTKAQVVEVASQQAVEDPAPQGLQRLLSRLELADRLASGGYALTAIELAQLVEQPLSKLGQHQGAWRWRDWEVQPIEGGSRWRLHRDAAGSKQNDEAGHG